MQVTFNPKEVDASTCAVLLGLILPGFVKSCRAQGDTRDEVIAGLSELVSHCFDQLRAHDEGA